MSDAKCSGCGAPAGASPACEFCGRMLRQPASAEDEIAAVRAQSQAVLRLAGDANTRPDAMVLFWQSAYIPTTVEALRLGLQATMAALPAVSVYDQAKQQKELVGIVHSRAVTLAEALRFHPEAPEITRQEASRYRRTIHDRGESLRIALAKDSALGIIMGAAIFGSAPAFMVGINVGTLAGWAAYIAILLLGLLGRHLKLAKRPFDEKA